MGGGPPLDTRGRKDAHPLTHHQFELKRTHTHTQTRARARKRLRPGQQARQAGTHAPVQARTRPCRHARKHTQRGSHAFLQDVPQRFGYETPSEVPKPDDELFQQCSRLQPVSCIMEHRLSRCGHLYSQQKTVSPRQCHA